MDITESAVSYTGEYLNGKWHGHGILEFPDGTAFEGEFADDAPVTDEE